PDPEGLPPLRNSMNLRLNVGARWFNQTDQNHEFFGNYFWGTGDSTNGPTDTLSLEFALGYQHPSGLGLELGFGPLPIESVYVMPLYRLSSRGLGTRPALHTFGAQLGWGIIGGDTAYYYNDAGNNYLDQTVQMDTYTMVYRVEEMLSPRLSLGLELAYHFAWAGVDYTHYDTTTYTNVQEHATVNYSGPSVQVTLAAWPVAPFWTSRDQAAVDDLQARREQRIEARLERIEARRAAVDSDPADYASAADAMIAGERGMADRRFQPAEAAFQQATLLAPQDPQAWRGLANAEYALGKHARAYTHYKEALRLSPGDKALREFVDKLKDRLREDLDLN
ncbi:MAG TPA: tetratricopeptide repeat protein, partial [bacterium]|nr:tetratricopeptide repeat protein [bacterium]